MNQPKQERIVSYLQHMVDAIDRAILHTQSMSSFGDFEKNWMACDAVVRCIEIIGEAATKIVKSDPAFSAQHAKIPWSAMCTMRNKLIHDYFEVDYEIVWKTVKNDLPVLRSQIAGLVAILS